MYIGENHKQNGHEIYCSVNTFSNVANGYIEFDSNKITLCYIYITKMIRNIHVRSNIFLRCTYVI
jgi:hypothetical protein